MLLKVARYEIIPPTPALPGQAASHQCPPPRPDDPPVNPPDDSGGTGSGGGGNTDPSCPSGFHYIVCCDFGGGHSCDPVNSDSGCVTCGDGCERINPNLRPVYIGECQ